VIYENVYVSSLDCIHTGEAVLTRLAGISWGQVLVGESLVKQDDPCGGIAKLFGEDISRKEASMA